ncbi:MAG: SPASM domain-containing protein, partial [Actinomycetota bacterium]
EVHDGIHGKGAFSRTADAIRWANESRLPLQVHTTVCERNLGDLERIAALLSTHRVLLWTVSFPALRHQELLNPEETENTFARLYRLSRLVTFKIKTPEAPHYRRYVLQQRTRLKPGHPEIEDGIPGVMPVVETRGSLFITSTGEVYPSACLPVSGGNIRTENLGEIYRESDLFQSLRDPSRLRGKCGRCNFKEICGGSRSRALAVAGDMFAEDSSCVYEPPATARTQEWSPKAL